MHKGWLLLLVAATLSSFSLGQSRTGSGEAAFFDSTAFSDGIRLTMTGVSAPAGGKVYVAWLGADDDAQYLKLGQITVQGNGAVALAYGAGSGTNLLASYKKFIMTEETSPFSGSTPTLSSIVFADSLAGPGVPGSSSNLTRIRNCLATFSNTEQNFGLAIWMKKQIPGYVQHAGFARDGMSGNNVQNAQLHSDHVYDFIRGALTGKVSGNSSVANNNDTVGYGFRRYADLGTMAADSGGAGPLGGAGYYVSLVVNDPSATSQMKKAGGRALLALRNAFGAANDSGFARQVTDRAVDIINGVYSTGSLVTEGNPFYDLALKFVNGTVSATDTGAATGGVLQAYYHMQRMAAFILSAPVQPTSVERISTSVMPDQFGLDQNYPNPFNGITRITFRISSPCRVTLSVYNLLGQEIVRLVDGGEFSPGVYATSWNSGAAGSGAYFLKLSVSDERGARMFDETRQMALVK